MIGNDGVQKLVGKEWANLKKLWLCIKKIMKTIAALHILGFKN